MTDAPPFPDEDELPDETPDVSEIDPFEVDPSEYEDVNEFVEADWAESKTARQRVKDVIVRTTSPVSAAEVADFADVSEPTARNELNGLAEEGTVLAESTDSGRVYQRDPDWYRIKRVRKLADEPRAELERTLRQLNHEIDDYRDEYDADTPEDLVLSAESLSSEVWEDISHWRTAVVDREYLRTALQYARLQRSEASVPSDEQSEDEETASA